MTCRKGGLLCQAWETPNKHRGGRNTGTSQHVQAQTLFEQSLKSWLRLLNLRPRTCTLAPWRPPGGVGSCPAPSVCWLGWHMWGPARSLLCQDPSSHLLPQSCPPEGHPSLNGVWGKTCQGEDHPPSDLADSSSWRSHLHPGNLSP